MNPTLKGAPNIAGQSYNISLLHTTSVVLFSLYNIVFFCMIFFIALLSVRKQDLVLVSWGEWFPYTC